MISKEDRIRRFTCADMTITHVIRKALADNLERIPFTIDGGYIATDIGETDEEENLHIIVSGYMEKTGLMLQQVTVIYFDSLEKANRFRRSPEGQCFDDPYGCGQDSFDFTTYAGNPKLPELISIILKNYFDFKDMSPVVAQTYCEVDYFRKEPGEYSSRGVKS